MGGQQSRPSPPSYYEKVVTERLKSLQLEEDDYVEISEKGHASHAGITGLGWKSQGLSTDVLDYWIEAILDDPKNK